MIVSLNAKICEKIDWEVVGFFWGVWWDGWMHRVDGLTDGWDMVGWEEIPGKHVIA